MALGAGGSGGRLFGSVGLPLGPESHLLRGGGGRGCGLRLLLANLGVQDLSEVLSVGLVCLGGRLEGAVLCKQRLIQETEGQTEIPFNRETSWDPSPSGNISSNRLRPSDTETMPLNGSLMLTLLRALSCFAFSRSSPESSDGSNLDKTAD